MIDTKRVYHFRSCFHFPNEVARTRPSAWTVLHRQPQRCQDGKKKKKLGKGSHIRNEKRRSKYTYASVGIRHSKDNCRSCTQVRVHAGCPPPQVDTSVRSRRPSSVAVPRTEPAGDPSSSLVRTSLSVDPVVARAQTRCAAPFLLVFRTRAHYCGVRQCRTATLAVLIGNCYSQVAEPVNRFGCRLCPVRHHLRGPFFLVP